MRSRVAVALVALLAFALPVRAAEFVPGWTVDGVWDSNVLRSTTDQPEEDDFSVRTGPNIQFREKQGDLQYELSYRPRYEAYLETDGINDFDQFVDARADWRITNTTEIDLSNTFAYTSSLAAFVATTGVGPDQVSVVSPERQRITLNNGDIGLTHRMGPLWEFSVRYSNQLVEYDSEFGSDSLANSGLMQITRGITPRLIVGGGAQVQRQDFDGLDGVTEDNGTTFYQGFGVLSYAFSRTLRLSLNAGPAWSVPDDPPGDATVNDYQPVDPSTCPRRADGAPVFNTSVRNGGCQPAFYRSNGVPLFFIVPGFGGAPQQERTRVPFVGEISEGSLSYFGRISISKEWRLWRATGSFERTASTASGVGGSTVLSALSGNLRWTPTRHWTFELTGIYTLQEAANDVREQLFVLDSDSDIVPDLIGANVNGTTLDLIADPVGVPFEIDSGGKIDNAIEINTYRIELSAERRISRNLRLTGRASYWHQQSESDLREDREQEIMRVIFGINWTFDPIPL